MSSASWKIVVFTILFGTFGAVFAHAAEPKNPNKGKTETKSIGKANRVAGGVVDQAKKESVELSTPTSISNVRKEFEQTERFVPINRIDELILAGLKSKKLEPAPLCSDGVFVRRVYLDVTGTLPTEEQARKFILDTKTDKRATLIDELLNSNGFADYWAMKWADVLRVKAEFPINLWPNGAMVYYRWIHAAMRENKPYDKFAYELLTADGSNFRDAPANFYRAVAQKEAETISENVAQTFLGVRIGPWPEEKRNNIAVFFSRVAFKGSAQWKEEIVYWDRKPLDSPNVVFPDGTEGTVKPNRDPRTLFADWLVSANNVGFRENVANRVWFWLFGRGLVNEPDDFRPDNPPIYPELLTFLGKDLAAHKFDLKHLYRMILNSRTYQQSSIPKNPKLNSATDIIPSDFFAAYPVRRLEAEVLQDAFNQIFDLRIGYTSEVPEPFTFVPPRYRTILLPDPSVTSSFLEMFGRATRDSGLESDRNNDVTEAQQLFMLNSTEMNDWAKKFLGRFSYGNKSQQERRAALDRIWLAILSRYPTQLELQRFVDEVKESGKGQYENVQDLIWTLINTKEFFCRH